MGRAGEGLGDPGQQGRLGARHGELGRQEVHVYRDCLLLDGALIVGRLACNIGVQIRPEKTILVNIVLYLVEHSDL